jgi:folylpolyglutamate synthase/dihydropteroate synthase
VHSQDLPLASIEPAEIAVTLNSIGVSSEIVADQDEAYEHFIDRTEDVGVVTGSFYLIAQLRQKYPALR